MRYASLLLSVLLAVTLLPAAPVTGQTSTPADSCPVTGGDPPTLAYNHTLGDPDLNLTMQIADYLSQTGSAEGLEAAIESAAAEDAPLEALMADVATADITGDGQDDVLVQFSVFFGGGYTGRLVLYICTEGAFQPGEALIHSEMFGPNDNPPVTIAAVSDLTGNGLPDIVLRQGAVFQKFQERVLIYEWDGSGLATLYEGDYTAGFYDDVAVRNFDFDATTRELLLDDRYPYTSSQTASFNEISVWRPVRRVLAWDGEQFGQWCMYFTDEPQTRYQALHSAESYLSCGLLDDAEAMYERLLADDDLEPWTYSEGVNIPADASSPEEYIADLEAGYLRAFAYYRLVQMASVAGEMPDTQRQLEDVRRLYPPGTPGAVYIQLADVYLDAFEQQQISEVCDTVQAEAPRLLASDGHIDYLTSQPEHDGTHGFYLRTGIIYSADPDNLFEMPQGLAEISIPVCLKLPLKAQASTAMNCQLAPIEDTDRRERIDWSRDGESIVFQLEKRDDLIAWNIASQEQTTYENAWEIPLAWTPTPAMQAWNPQGTRLAVLETESVIVMDASGDVLYEKPAHNAGLEGFGIAWSFDGRFLAITKQRGGIQFWEAETGELHWEIQGWTRNVAWHPTANLFVMPNHQLESRVADAQFGMEVYDIDTRQLAGELLLPPVYLADYGSNLLSNPLWSQDGQFLLAEFDMVPLSPVMWNWKTRERVVSEIPSYYARDTFENYVAMSPVDRYRDYEPVIVYDSMLIWNLETMSVVASSSIADNDWHFHVRWSPDGQYIAFSSPYETYVCESPIDGN